MPSAFLIDRAFIHVSGTGAMEFLQNLVTPDLESLPEGEARAGALLTPQGKIMFEFLIWREGDGYVLETGADQQDALLRRLTMYKLRAPVDLKAGETNGVSVFWDEPAPEDAIKDSRFAKAGVELYRLPGHSTSGEASAYDALRIANGIVVAGIDYPLSDAFPHDVLMDVNDGVSFKKGCYVGQEVVSRMKHRGTARRRVVTVTAEADLPANGTDILAGGKPIGTLGSVIGKHGLAIIRTDRAADAMASGTDITASGIAVTVALPAWTGLSFPAVDPAANADD
ncbi:YgfZ/GcvT domain-containing protein [Agrobacterium rubi]|uniref:Folate-binding protein YgfZ n=1 Tax=Agrobacterium rubi TaxID=28099 RepID=A0AAE7R324_9HYPH|nr:folate-binding protein YgfZ [Agrobacterium rubi]NTE85911.1 folate-binding protein YgfZ [Agrobacterium rubi]NTF01842.1 folate-binding protein YgfZ [Agrobacterium rubi]NTF36086.1 folate-binding protein YgfZ [Agrobacterium rubi]OCJ54731.1 aminomethyltransferase [Agrobacterium rubi]QTG01173.1 folate-binding protein YgfZ [Agrobacterium rubi]